MLGGRGVVYKEGFGPHSSQAAVALLQLRRSVDRLRQEAAAQVEVGVSPHAPYTVSAPLFREVARYAQAESLPLAVHLAESHAETEFVTRAQGPFAELWRRRQVPLPPPSRSPVAYLDGLGVLDARTLVIHGIQVDEPDLDLLARRRVSVALCPRSNARHGHGFPPARRYVAAGIPFGVGTDSVISVESMDLFAEVRVLADLAGLDPAAAVRAITLGGAEALQLAGEIGSLDAGKAADLCLLAARATGSPHERIAGVLEAGVAGVRAVWVAGRQVHSVAGPGQLESPL
jgi:5-methylthioadenosine/S-adenosylhomocysteine deaminase